jgi:fructokinase
MKLKAHHLTTPQLHNHFSYISKRAKFPILNTANTDTSPPLWGIDLGGTKAEGVVLGPGGLKDIRFRDRVPTGAENGYDFILNQIKTLVSTMETKMGYRPDRLGICTPGTLDPGLGTMKGCNSECMNGQPMKTDIEQLIGLPIEIANDANCFALAEARMGVVKEKFPQAKVVYGVIMGTGVGGGLVINNQVINGLQGIAGEWGHNFLDASGGPCYCGKSGCVEKVISGPDLERFYHQESGSKLIMKEIYERFRSQKDPHAVKTIDRLIHFYGLALSVIINILDPDVIVIGGGVGNVEEIYTEGRKSVAKYIFNHRLDTPIVKPMLGDSAGVFGAAYLVA